MTKKNIEKKFGLVNTKTAYSIVVPIYNEENSIQELINEIETVMVSLSADYQLVLVNDGSTDRSLEIIKHIQKTIRHRKIDLVNILRQKGQTFALKKGFEKSSGRIIISLDADLQNDPADIPRLLKKMEDGFDVICGWRRQRKDPLMKQILSKTGNFLQRFLGGLKIHDMSCTLRVYKRETLASMSLDNEGDHRYIPFILYRKGFIVGECTVTQRKRKHGKSKYKNRKAFYAVIGFIRLLRYELWKNGKNSQ